MPFIFNLSIILSSVLTKINKVILDINNSVLTGYKEVPKVII